MTRSSSPFARAFVASVFLLPLALGACGAGSSRLPTDPPGGDGDADFHDGSRLTFPVWRTADGFTVRKGTVHDAMFDVACAFEPADDGGTLRCLPVSLSGFNYRFADAACSQPLASDSLDDRYVRFTRYGERCPNTYWIEIREAGARVEATTVYEWRTEGCVAIARSARDSYRYTGAVIPPDRFVAAQEVVVQPPGRARLGAVRLVAEDGAWLQQPTFHDTRDDVRCSPQLASDGRFRCLPAARYALSSFADRGQPDCSGPQIANVVGCAAGDVEAVEVTSSSCPRHVALHARGADWDGSRFGFDASGVCVAANLKVTSGVEVGAELDPAQYALLELQQLGTGRLRTSVYVDVDIHAGHTVRASGTSPYDTLLGGPCTFTTDDAGATRCQPQLLTTAFRDTRCSDPAAVDMYSWLTDPCFATVDAAPRYASMGGALYGPATRAPQRFDQLFTLGPNANCQDATSSLTESWVTHYTMGPRASFNLVAASP